jgi:hypothetical protein
MLMLMVLMIVMIVMRDKTQRERRCLWYCTILYFKFGGSLEGIFRFQISHKKARIFENMFLAESS